MYNSIDYTKLGGIFTYQDTFDIMQTMYGYSSDAGSKFIGEKFVLTGCVDDGINVTDGWIVVNGERLPFIGGLKTAVIIIEEILGNEAFDDGSIKQVYTTRRAKFGNIITGPLDFNYVDLKRVPYHATSIGDFSQKINTILQAIIQFEPEVILDGCEVTAITTGPDTCDISAGLILFGGKLISSPAYSGSYPAYLKEDGGWVNAVPGAGLYITFDPHTSQRYKNVLDRATIPSGRIIMEETLSDRFNPLTGIGKWEMKGYRLMTSMQGRAPIGLWFDTIPVDNVTDPFYTVAGPAIQVGENKHKLSTTEQGTFEVRKKNDDGFGTSGGGYSGEVDTQFNGQDVPIGGANASSWGTALEVSLSIADDAHENRQPSTVIVYAKRI